MIKAKTITEAKYLLEQSILSCGYRQFIQRGEFAGEETFRIQSRPVHIVIAEPLNFFDLPKDVTEFALMDYCLELFKAEKPPEADYTYGERIYGQYDIVARMLADTPSTNQAVIEIAQPSDIHLKHMPCLRMIQFVVYDGKLNAIVVFRSNDVSEAFIYNHGGIAIMLGMIAEQSGYEPGEYNYFSAGAHIYSHSL